MKVQCVVGFLGFRSSRFSSLHLKHTYVLFSILFISGCECLHSLVRKDKANKRGVVIVLHLLL